MRTPRIRILLALLVAVSLCVLPPRAHAARIDWSKARPITVVTVEYRFEPNHLILRRGSVYRLHVDNRGRELHELTAPDFFKAVQMRNPEVLNRERTEITLQPGDRKELDFMALRLGRYGIRCADHDWAGMTGDITVK